MFIQTQVLSDENRMEFFPGAAVYPEGPLEIKRDDEHRSAMASRLFAIDGVLAAVLMPDRLVVEKSGNTDWSELKTFILGAVMQHYESGDSVVSEAEAAVSEADQEIVAQAKELLATRILPVITQSGGDIAFHSYKEGRLYLKMQGSAFTMLTGIQNMLRHYIPEITAVFDHREAIARPGLNTEAGLAIQQLLEQQINPSIASHGGHISLVDVSGDKAFVRLEGGCQGCGMADVTLKQGVATEIMARVPQITEVLDVTDHAGGDNPYYQPGK